MFLAVAYLFKTKGLSCLIFLEFQPLANVVAYKPLLIKQNKCINFTPFRKDKKTVLQKNKMQTQTPKSTNAREPFSNECWTDKLRTEKFYSV